MAASRGWRAMALAGVVALGATGGTWAQTVFGRWVLTAEPDHFGDGGTYVAATVDRTEGYVLAIRCIRKEWSLALGESSPLAARLPQDGIYRAKLRVDRGTIVEAVGMPVSAHLVQFETKDARELVRSIVAGHALAVRFIGAGGSVDMTFPLPRVKQALAVALYNCPLDDGAK